MKEDEKPKTNLGGRVKVPFRFDDAMQRAMRVEATENGHFQRGLQAGEQAATEESREKVADRRNPFGNGRQARLAWPLSSA